MDRFSFSKISVVVSFIECPCKGATLRAVVPETSVCVCDLRDIAVKYHNQKLIETKTLVMELSGICRTQESSAYLSELGISAIVTRFYPDCSVVPKIITWYDIGIIAGFFVCRFTEIKCQRNYFYAVMRCHSENAHGKRTRPLGPAQSNLRLRTTKETKPAGGYNQELSGTIQISTSFGVNL